MNDLKFTIRQLRKRPGFALAVMLTLAVGSGSSTVVMAIANAVLYRLVVRPEPDRLVFVSQSHERRSSGCQISYPNFCDWRAQNRVFEEMAIVGPGGVNCRAEGDRACVTAFRVSAGYFPTQRVRAALGLGLAVGATRGVNRFLAHNNMGIPEVVVDGRVTLAAVGLICLRAFLLSWLLYRTQSGNVSRSWAVSAPLSGSSAT
jgi:hypothetical protein